MCVLLLITAAILLHGVRQVGVIDRGLSTRDNLALRIDDAFRPRVVERLSADPSVGALAAAAAAPVDRKPMLAVTPDEGRRRHPHGCQMHVSPDYFSLLEIGFVSGRNFTPQEAATAAPRGIVSQSTARRLWPNRNAVGRFLRMAGDPRPLAVIGVARDEISRRIMSGDETPCSTRPSPPSPPAASYSFGRAAKPKPSAAKSTPPPSTPTPFSDLQAPDPGVGH